MSPSHVFTLLQKWTPVLVLAMNVSVSRACAEHAVLSGPAAAQRSLQSLTTRSAPGCPMGAQCVVVKRAKLHLDMTVTRHNTHAHCIFFYMCYYTLFGSTPWLTLIHHRLHMHVQETLTFGGRSRALVLQVLCDPIKAHCLSCISLQGRVVIHTPLAQATMPCEVLFATSASHFRSL